MAKKAGKVTRKNPDMLKDLENMVRDLPEIAVGFPKGKATSATYPDGTSVLNVAVWNNFGTKTIPARRFMEVGGNRALKETLEIRKDIFKKNVNLEKIDDKVFERIGAIAATQIKKTITEWKEPPNAPSTIARKGTDNPLIDTGFMRQTVTYQVRPKENE